NSCEKIACHRPKFRAAGHVDYFQTSPNHFHNLYSYCCLIFACVFLIIPLVTDGFGQQLMACESTNARRAYEQYPFIQKFCADEGYRGTFVSDLKEQLDL